MGDWPLNYAGGEIESIGVPSATSRGTGITASGTVNTKGSYAQLKAATDREAYGLYVVILSDFALANYLVDIGIGAATEAILIPDLMYCRSNDNGVAAYYFPIRIPAGSRIAARCQASSASAQCWVACYGMPADPRLPAPFSRVTAYGIDSANSRGTNVPGNASANTKGATTQIVASTTNPMRQFVVGCSPGGDVARVTHYTLFDVMVGAATEDKILSDMAGMVTASGDYNPNQVYGPFPCNVPASSRLAMAHQASTTTAGDRDYTYAIYGID